MITAMQMYINQILYTIPVLVIFVCLLIVLINVIWNVIGFPFSLSKILRVGSVQREYRHYYAIVALVAAICTSFFVYGADSISILILGSRGRLNCTLQEFAVGGLTITLASSIFWKIKIVFLRLFIRRVLFPLRRYRRRLALNMRGKKRG